MCLEGHRVEERGKGVKISIGSKWLVVFGVCVVLWFFFCLALLLMVLCVHVSLLPLSQGWTEASAPR